MSIGCIKIMAIRRWWWREEKKYCRFDFCVCPVKICVTLYNTQRENDITPTRRNEAHTLSTELNRREREQKKSDWRKKENRIVSHTYCDLTSSSVCVCERMWSSPCEWRSFLSLNNCYLRLCNLFFKPLLIIFVCPLSPHPHFGRLVHFFTAYWILFMII